MISVLKLENRPPKWLMLYSGTPSSRKRLSLPSPPCTYRPLMSSFPAATPGSSWSFLMTSGVPKTAIPEVSCLLSICIRPVWVVLRVFSRRADMREASSVSASSCACRTPVTASSSHVMSTFFFIENAKVQLFYSPAMIWRASSPVGTPKCPSTRERRASRRARCSTTLFSTNTATQERK